MGIPRRLRWIDRLCRFSKPPSEAAVPSSERITKLMFGGGFTVLWWGALLVTNPQVWLAASGPLRLSSVWVVEPRDSGSGE